MWSDHESEFDYLNFRETAGIISELVANPDLRPVSVGVFGGWGSGKSTLIKLSRENLEEDKNTIVIDFDAWLYQGFDDARSALLEAVSSKLLQVAQENETAVDKAVSLLKRINKLRALGLLAEGGALLMGTPAFGAFYKGVVATGNILDGHGDGDDLQDAKEAVKQGTKTVGGLLNDKETVSPPKEILAFRNEFSALLDELDKTLVVYVDNLDRCLPKNAILTLEAIRLILFMPNTAFVIAADEDMIKLAVQEHYSTSQSRLINDYLDKLIQIPLYVPRLGVAEITSYTFLLFCMQHDMTAEMKIELNEIFTRSLRSLWNRALVSSQEVLAALQAKYSVDHGLKVEIENSYVLASRLAPMLANSRKIAGNPRIVKRLLNSIWMRSSIAKKRNMPNVIDKALIAKIALFERCTTDKASTELYRQINESMDGKPEIISALEANDDISKPDLPEAWDDVDFTRNWLGLEPKLSGVDLRAIAYLARETLPVRVSSEGLSPATEQILKILLKVDNLSSPAVKKALTGLPPDEAVPLIEIIIEELRKCTDWRSKPEGFIGAIALADQNPEAAQKLETFINSIGKLPNWMGVLVNNRDWYKQ